MPPPTPALLATDAHVALLVASRSPRASHAVLAAVNRHMARTVLSKKGAVTLRRERVASGWIDGVTSRRHRVPLDSLSQEVLDDPSPGYLLNKAVAPNCQLAIFCLCKVIVDLEALRRGVSSLGETDRRAAIVDFCVPIIQAFYSFKLSKMSDRGARLGLFGGGDGMFGALMGFAQHVDHATKVIEYAEEAYDPADGSDREMFSHYGKRLVEAGVLEEHYDEASDRWSIDADGPVMRATMALWRKLAKSKPLEPESCPLDAPMIVLLAYILVCRDETARRQLHVTMRDPDDLVLVRGGFIETICLPRHGNAPAIGNFLEVYIEMLGGSGWSLMIQGS